MLGIAKRSLPGEPDRYELDELEQDLIFLGLAAMKDPLRPEAVAAVQVCQDAGIRIVMITGDHKDTAVAIARELWLFKPEVQALTGAELDLLTDAELVQRVASIAVYARVSAEHKLRIVRAWKTYGAVVAMTGDSVNDAPAVKEADIGVAMGLTGTDVTKEASDMVVTDDNFASIAAAVEAGRGIYNNILKAVHYLLSGNIAEILVMLLAMVLGLPLPLLPVQILWINLVTDGFPALALAEEPSDQDIMRRPPRAPEVRFLEWERILIIFGQGMFISLITLAAFASCLYSTDKDLVLARTVAFTVLVVAHLVHAFNCRSDRSSLLKIGLWTNRPLLLATVASAVLQVTIVLTPWTREVFKVAPLNPEHWVLAFGLGILPLLAMEGWKALTETMSSFRPSRIA